MFKALKEEWAKFKGSEPGTRFIEYHRRVKKASTRSRVLRIALGLVLFGVGVLMLFIPGPGLLFMVFGLACFGGESAWISIRLDKLELKARAAWKWLKRKWNAMPTRGKVATVVVALAVAAFAVWGAYKVLWA